MALRVTGVGPFGAEGSGAPPYFFQSTKLEALMTQQSNPQISAGRPNRFAQAMPIAPITAMAGMDTRLTTETRASTRESADPKAGWRASIVPR